MTKWNLIFRLFVAEYLNLRPESGTKSPAGRANGDLVRRSTLQAWKLLRLTGPDGPSSRQCVP